MSISTTIRARGMLALVAALLMAAPSVALPQSGVPAKPAAAETANVNQAGSPPTRDGDGKAGVKADPKAEPKKSKLSRWFELQIATLSARYRWIKNSAGLTTNKELQHSEVFRGRFKFDREGKYTVNFNLASGNAFIVGWNATGVGTGEPAANLYMKQLYISAMPVNGLELQYGGLPVQRGESTEITSYDNDAYIVGQRVNVRRPKMLFFDEVSVTYAYLGDLNRPSIFQRLGRLGESNYHQFMVRKSLGNVGSVSADYTFQSGVETLREAVKLNARPLRVVDTVRFELYQRLDDSPDAGFAVSAEKNIYKRLNVVVGFASIDRDYGGLNADRFDRGNRVYLSASYKINPEFGVQTFYGRAVSNPYDVTNRNRFELIFSYDLLSGLKRAGLL